MNYEKLVEYSPTEYGRLTNRLGQEIIFVEHPFKGDEHPVIAVCHTLEIAKTTEFFDVNDMMAVEDYEPFFIGGELQYGYQRRKFHVVVLDYSTSQVHQIVITEEEYDDSGLLEEKLWSMDGLYLKQNQVSYMTIEGEVEINYIMK